jgi:UDP-N-acetylmuramoylalanine-D-glutamate ligase
MTHMDKHLTPEAYENLQQKILEGQGTLVILPGVAPDFFKKVFKSSIESTTRIKVTEEKLLIWGSVKLALLLACVANVAQSWLNVCTGHSTNRYFLANFCGL